MTTIAVRDGIMAADSGVSQEEYCFGSTQKIQRLSDGSLIAAAGTRPLVQQFHRWMLGAGQKPEPVESESFGALWLKSDGIWRISHKFEIYDDPWPFAAEGINVSFMLGAMAAGADAKRAVELAIAHGGGIGPMQWKMLE